MPYAKRYEEYEVRDLLKDAEGNASPATNAPAHSRGLHARSIRGGTGITLAGLTARVNTMGLSNSQLKNQGIKLVGGSSMFRNLIHQGAAATQALNSATGQAALAIFDSTPEGGPLRIILKVANIKEAGFLDAVSAPSVTFVMKGNNPVPQTTVTAGVTLIIDRDSAAGKIFIQSCIPVATPGFGSRWEVLNPITKAVVANG